MSLPSTTGHSDHEMPPKYGHGPFIAMKGPCWLEVGPCQLPLQRLNHDHYKMLNFNMPWKEFRVETKKIRHSVLWEKPRKSGLQIVRCFQVKIFMSPNSYIFSYLQFISVQFSRLVMSNSLRPHGLQQTRFPCPSPILGAYSNSCPLSWWCHPTVSSSVVPSSSCLQSFPASGPFQMSQFFASDGQSIGVSASASVLPMNFQDWFPLGWTGWTFLLSKGLSRVFSNTTVQKH